MAQKVTLKGKTFYVGNERFYPKALNYGVDWVHKNGTYYFSSHHSYNINNYYECTDLASCTQQIQDEFNYIAGMGFNTLRIVGICPEYDTTQKCLVYCFRQHNTQGGGRIYLPVNQFSMGIIFPFYDKLLELADAAGLKVIFLIGGGSAKYDEAERAQWNAYLGVVSAHLNNTPHKDALFAYDLFNEPCYRFSEPYRSKQEACEIVSTWYDIVKSNDPNTLITIGTCGIADAFNFDPSVLKVDFHSLHYYPAFKPFEDRTTSTVQELMRKRTLNELYWFNQATIVPWMIGETGFSATDENTILIHGTLANQKTFAEYSLETSCNCGASGYSWWQYQDVSWYFPSSSYPFNMYKENFFGLLRRNHAPSPTAEKPAVNVFRNYPALPQPSNPCPVDYSPTFDENKLYYNRFGYKAPNNMKIERIVKDQYGNPIKDAVIRVATYFGADTCTITVNGITKDTTYWRGDAYYTHTDINGKFVAIPCTTRYGFVGHGTIPTFIPEIYDIRVSAAGADVYESGYIYYNNPVPNPILLNKIKDDVIVSGETVLNGQYKEYKGRRSLTVSNTTVHSGGWAEFTSQKLITILAGFIASAGPKSLVYLYIAPPDCNELSWSSPKLPTGGSSYLLKTTQEEKTLELSFETDIPENFISVFPNPTNSTVTIQLHSNDKDVFLNHIKLYDIFGRTILSQPVSGISHILDVLSYPKGFYFIKVETESKSYYQKLIIK